MKAFAIATVSVLLLSGLSATGAPKSRDQQVIEDRDDLEKNQDWIYNDLKLAELEAGEKGKPMMIVFRCIP